MIIICNSKIETEDETTYNAYLGTVNLGTMSHRKGTGIWLVRNLEKTKWRTCELIESFREVFFPTSTEEILFVDIEGNAMLFPTEE